MLQQTQVATVVPFYTKFLQRFPNVRLLAAADEQDVLRSWEGLGYYRRARQLHAAARQIVTEHGGEMPADFATWRTLPGLAATRPARFSPSLSINDSRSWRRTQSDCMRD